MPDKDNDQIVENTTESEEEYKSSFIPDKVFSRRKIFEELNKRSEDEREELIMLTGLKKRYRRDVRDDNEKFPSLPAIIAFAHVLKKPVDYFLYEEPIFVELIKEEYVYIPHIEPLTDKNNGLIHKNEKYSCACKIEPLYKLTNNPFSLVYYIVDSDAMESTFSKGDEILIDTSAKQIKDCAIYAYNSYEFKHIRIRRISIQINNIKLIADNKSKYDPCITNKKDINIIGQVIIAKHFLL